ncbi:hypothetical protein ABV409_05730 [Flagellimonas sp. DF-77]|uniref:hypothetical protein n=1 Tax=Flagellimonas algarum TaxID=3230298 RepID=UPI00339A1FB0
MKITRIVVIAVLILTTHTANAQFLKKLGKRAERSAKNAIEFKVGQKTRRITQRAFDSVFNNEGKLLKGKKGAPSSDYTFTHKYVLRLDDGKHQSDLNYFLSATKLQFAIYQTLDEQSSMITVIDGETKRMHNFSDLKGKKSRMSMQFNDQKSLQQTMETPEFSIEPTGNEKDILGFHSKEYAVSGKYAEGTIWMTTEAGVGFPSEMFKAMVKKNKGNQWFGLKGGLVMEMDMVDLSSKKNERITMRCIELKAEELVLEVMPYN